jgi:spore germination protein YaaH
MTWPKALAQYLGMGWPREKLLFSLPFYGYEWPVESDAPRAATTGMAQTVTFAPVDAQVLPDIRLNAQQQAQRHGLLRDAGSGSPFYRYQDEQGQWRQGWFEDDVSLAAKLAWLREEGLAGAAVFPLGYDAGAFDTLMARSVKAG